MSESESIRLTSPLAQLYVPPPPDLSSMPPWTVAAWWQIFRIVLAEVIGTMVLTFVCTAYSGVHGGLVGGALAGGITLFIMIWQFGSVSGGHVNPAVTLIFTIQRRLSLLHTLFYFAAQIVGGILGAYIAIAFLPADQVATRLAGITQPGKGISPGQALGMEAFSTGVVILLATLDLDELRRDCDHFRVALTVGLEVMAFALVFVSPVSLKETFVQSIIMLICIAFEKMFG
ncbi:unnamed protein product [Protopolystoma xenopodis]|uniref:Aquaporin n=1 Tax=Protopolystoma xenopodis TaxID=117903 RepID=A0A3S4ZEI2_9PLAT|nr:unnamed protein product [Protopolystoma xenopodis]